MRLFTAIEIPESFHEELASLQEGVAGVHWTLEEHFHLTLRFIGDLDRRTAEDADDALASIAAKPFPVTLSGVGTFGDPPRVLWAGVERSERLMHLVEKVDSALTRARVPFEARKYAPHVTLGRSRGPMPHHLADWLKRHGTFRTEAFLVSHFCLYSSVRTHQGSDYTVERVYVL